MQRLPLNSVRNRLVLLFFAITAAAVGFVYLYVVPQLRSSLTADRLDRLEAAAAEQAPEMADAMHAGVSQAKLRRLVRDVAAGLTHLHARGLLHGDVYGHNILWDAATGAAALSDFGAASVLPDGPAGAALQRIEVRAFGLLLGEALDRASADFSDAAGLRDLERACIQADVGARPAMAEVLRALS